MKRRLLIDNILIVFIKYPSPQKILYHPIKEMASRCHRTLKRRTASSYSPFHLYFILTEFVQSRQVTQDDLILFLMNKR